MIDEPDFSAAEDISLSPGVYILELVAGEREQQEVQGAAPVHIAERRCVIEFNVRQGDDLAIFINDVPVASKGVLSGCPVGTLVLYPVYPS